MEWPHGGRFIISEPKPSVQDENAKPYGFIEMFTTATLFFSGGKRQRLTALRTVTIRDNWLIKYQISEHRSSIACCESKLERRAAMPNPTAGLITKV